MKKLFKISLLIFFAASFVFCSCEKKKLEKLENDWRLIRVDSLMSQISWYETWQFNEGKIEMLKRADSVDHISNVGSGVYSLKTKNTKTFVEIDSLAPNLDLNGEWQVLTLNKEILVIVREEPLWKYREFVLE